MRSYLVRTIGAALVTASLALAGPAQAQISFGFMFGDEVGDLYPKRVTCFTNGEIRQAIAARGYVDVFLNVPNDGRIEVRATRDGWVYLLDFDYCRDRIIAARTLRPAG
ncbi:MAG: hypothetical protein KIT02_03420 [Devosia sp.]|uniref:hypothetical protein n=1 Tax=Devosia sp. TaxID=1871048 RepID=UPI0024C9E5E8|nr:hypothetical protein [Devosia sp.]UYO00285.1 MAG: hypothetical protein KIT02_03420 [Devosia sp.]